MCLEYHLFQRFCLSPPTSRIAFRCGSKAKRIRISDRPEELGLSSFIFLCREAFTESTSGRPRCGPSHSRILTAAAMCRWVCLSSPFSHPSINEMSTYHFSTVQPLSYITQGVYLSRHPQGQECAASVRRNEAGAQWRSRVTERALWRSDASPRSSDGLGVFTRSAVRTRPSAQSAAS